MIETSIIIPSYNDGEKVIRLLNILLKKTNNLNYEIIIVESGTTIYQKDLSKKIIFLKSKKGRATQMNKAAKISKGKNLLFLHADSKVSQINFKSLNIESWGYFKIKFNSNKTYFRIIEFTSQLRAKIFKIPFGDQGLLITKKLFNKVKGFDQKIFEDINIALKLKKINPPKQINQNIVSSPRRFIEHGIFKTHITMGIILIAYLLHQQKLAKAIYKLII